MGQSTVLARVLGLVLALSLPSLAIAQEDAAPPKVTIAAAITKKINQNAEFIGRGEAINKIDLVARVSGFLDKIAVKDGSDVKKGDLLFEIESAGYTATLNARKADLKRAEADLELAKIELSRKQTLFERQAGTEEDRDNALANEKIAEAAIESAKAAIELAELDVSYTKIHAPFDGHVGRINQSVGDIVSTSSANPITTLVQQAPIYVSFSITEKQLVDIRTQIGTTDLAVGAVLQTLGVYVGLPNGKTLDEKGTIVFVDNRIDPTTGSIGLRAEFANEKGLLFDGAFVSVTVETSEAVDKLLIPLASVQRDQQGAFVLLVNQQQMVEQRYVTLGEQIETSVVVEDGLQVGDSVIVEGLQRVRPGVPVDPVLAASPEE